MLKVGDLVRYKSHWQDLDSCFKDIGVIVRCITGTDRAKVVRWVTGIQCSYPERNLELVNESR